MMKSTLPSDDRAMNYESVRTIQSETTKGVSFTINRMSFGRRLELTRRIREVGTKLQFLASGEALEDKVEASLTAHEVDKLYLQWGLRTVDGLAIDGEAAHPESVISSGPEELCREIVQAIKAECGLTGEERKN
jgi:hypothetical protein